MSFQIKRAYEAPSADDGIRVLIDRLWPRGLKKTSAHLQFWMKDISPSPTLRKWFDHRPERFEEFSRRYRTELAGNPKLPELRHLGKTGVVTLVYAAHDPAVNHAVVLVSVLEGSAGSASRH
jgi:uncharacterized protein YeaO (DUF488 family)